MKNADKKEMYGLLWGQLTPQAYIELHMIRNGGRWKGKKGKYIGEGLAYHYQQFAKVVWPHVQWHKWNELLYKNFADHRFVGILGPAASGKTHTSAIFALTTYYAFSDCITIVCTSTELQRLEERIWGEIKAHHKMAKQVCDWLPGHNIDSRQRIVTDDRYESAEGRDFKNGICGVPCFISGTLVNTPEGEVKIEDIRIGQRVFNATGIGTVREIHSRTVDRLVRVTLSDGRIIDCTEEHPFLTKNGWTEARELSDGDLVLSHDEALHILRKKHGGIISESKVLFLSLCKFLAFKNLRDLWKIIFTKKDNQSSTLQGLILQLELLQQMDCQTQAAKKNISSLQTLRKDDERCIKSKNILFNSLSSSFRRNALSILWKIVYIHKRFSIKTKDEILQYVLSMEGDDPPKKEEGNRTDSRGVGGMETFSKLNMELPFPNWPKTIKWIKTLVQNRFSVFGYKTCCGNRWWSSPNRSGSKERCYQNCETRGTRVDSVKILEPRSDERFDASKGGYTVHNIEVDEHPSYSVNNVIVHNCKRGNSYVGLGAYVGIHNKYVMLCVDEGALLPPTFVDAIANMNKNVRFKAIVMGNPKDTTDALGKFCEPSAELNGWDGGIDQTGGTKTWPIRWPDGVCVQLVGSDCPNMDVHEELPVPYPYLITRKAIQTDIQFYGKDSVQFTMMNEGRMPRGQSVSRIITRNLCLKFGALEEPVWIDVKRTKIAFADIAYARQGGDRTVFGTLEFGKGLARDGKQIQIISLIGTMLVPVSAQDQESPEDQIANFIKERCEQDGIPPSHFYFDSTGRGSFISACARLWSPNINGIDFSSNASERPVSSAISTLCKDYYFNFVTELWWSFRLCIEAGQLRNLSNEAMEEACYREWGKVHGDKKIQVEPKEKMKIKSGRSPDIMDSIVCGIEGARRRGFVIAKLSNYILQEKEHRWKYDLVARAKELRESGALDYSV